MKRLYVVLAACVMAVSSWAYERPGFEWTVGTDVTSSYLWRGQNLGSFSIQPDLMVGYAGLKLEGWWNLSAEDYTFKKFAPEMDLTLSYGIAGFTVGVTHQYYFDGSKFFGLKNYSYEDYVNDNYSSTQLEVFGRFDLDYFFEDAPLHLMWATYVGGDDMYEVEENKLKRAYSSYLEVSYDFSLPLNFTLTPTIGITPWKSMYSYYQKNFAVNNLSLKVNWELELGDHFCLDVYAMGMLNTAGINVHNWITSADKRSASFGYEDPNMGQRMNGCIGVGIWFY